MLGRRRLFNFTKFGDILIAGLSPWVLPNTYFWDTKLNLNHRFRYTHTRAAGVFLGFLCFPPGIQWNTATNSFIFFYLIHHLCTATRTTIKSIVFHEYFFPLSYTATPDHNVLEDVVTLDAVVYVVRSFLFFT